MVGLTSGGVDEVMDKDVDARVEDLLGGNGDNVAFGLLKLLDDALAGCEVILALNPQGAGQEVV